MRLSVPVTLQLLLVLAGLAAGATTVLSVVAYRSEIRVLERDAQQAVGIAAQGREETLVRLLTARRERALGFLTSVTSSCGEVAPSGRIGFELHCVRTAVSEFRTTEHAAAARLAYRGRRIAQAGTWTPITIPNEDQLAYLVRPDGPDYATYAAASGLTLTLRFTGDDLNQVFQNTYGLGESGEVFLTDATGRAVTPLRYASASEPTGIPPASPHEPIADCLAGKSSQVVAPDYRGVKTIHGLRPVSVFGGGCVDAHVSFDEALAPAVDLRRDLVNRSAIFLAIAIALSLVASQWISRPIRHLVASARAMQEGEFDKPIKIGGPNEVRELGAAFRTMGAAIRDLIGREHGARLQAETANRVKDEFLAIVSHELRTPLTAILGWAHLLRYGNLDAERAAHAVSTIERSATSQSRLIDDLLDVSRISSGTLSLTKRRVMLASPVEAAIESIRPQADAKHVEIRSAIDRNVILGSADAQRLEQIAWNLLSNAVKFTPEDGRIEVTVTERDGRAELVVRDSGIGIEPEFLPHVFDRFTQADTTTTRGFGGLGLGLAIVRRLVELHGGTVRVESPGHGRGATFTVSIPTAIDKTAVIARPASVASEREPVLDRLDQVRVLVVDDDDDTREIIGSLLAGAGAEVITARSAAEARDALTHIHPSVLVSDIAMPVEDGCSLMRSLRAAGQTPDELPAIALTAYARPEDVDDALGAGFQVHMAKPVDQEDLVHTIALLAARDTDTPVDTAH
jgi:signal transduction histidine kinase/ActR/RegA family two-component response regulator